MDKVSFVKRFEPWGWVVGSGVYIDDVNAVVQHNALIMSGGSAVLAAVLLIISAALSG